MDPTIICSIITGVFAVIVAVCEAIAAKDRKRAERHAKLRAEESRLSMQMIDATLQLSIVTANALTNGHNNGNVERARTAAKKASEDYYDFLRKVASSECTKV